MIFRRTNFPPELDPRTQQVAEWRERRRSTAPTTATLEGEVAVIARVADRGAWKEISEVRPGVDLGGGPEFGGYLVTGRISASRVVEVSRHPAVRSLQVAQGVKRTMAATISEIEARHDLLPPGAQGQQGRGVVLGIIDFGCDFAHENFRNQDGSTRLLALWDQWGQPTRGSGLGYGRVYSSVDIDLALQSADPYATLGYRPESGPNERGTHGTHVMDIAAGNGRGSNVPGIAPNADLVFVEIAHSDIPWRGKEVVGSSFGDSVLLLEAMRFILDEADKRGRPCVINVSLGTNGGPHDGTTLVEQGIDALVNERPERAVVIAAGNSFDDGIHASGKVPHGGAVDLRWNVPVGDFSHNELEVWYGDEDEFTVEILQPTGASVATVALSESGRVDVLDSEGTTLLFVAHRRADPNNGDNAIGIFLEPGLPTGIWTVRLHGTDVKNGSFDAWIERDDEGQSRFLPPHDGSLTLGSIACGRKSIVVGSYDAHKPNLPLSWFSSSGPTRDQRPKPEISAPGHHVLAAEARSGTSVTRKSGTSMAAPAVAGVVALMLAEARARGRAISSDQIRDILITTARKDAPISGWDKRIGNGRVHARAAVEALT